MIPIHDDNPTELRPIVTVVLIAACCAISLVQLLVEPDTARAMVYQYGIIPMILVGNDSLPPSIEVIPAWLTPISSMFLHGGLLHLAANMLYLWIFGNNIEDAMGHGRFIAFYVACGLIATIAQVAIDPASTIPIIGASGAISGILGAYLLLYPTARIKMFLPLIIMYRIFHVRAVWVLLGWIVLQILGSAASGLDPQSGGTAYGAHLGGFAAGLLLIGLFKARGFRLHNPLEAIRSGKTLNEAGDTLPDQPVRQPGSVTAPTGESSPRLPADDPVDGA